MTVLDADLFRMGTGGGNRFLSLSRSSGADALLGERRMEGSGLEGPCDDSEASLLWRNSNWREIWACSPGRLSA